MTDLKYADVEARVTIEFVKEPKSGLEALKLVFVDKNFKELAFANGKLLEPVYLFLDKDPKTGKVKPVKFKHVSFTAEFNEEGFMRVAETLNEIDPFVGEWSDLDESNGNGRMNPSGPPKP